MLVVVACYTVCSLSDKYAVAKLKMDGNTLTWLMAAATAVFMLAYLPFDSRLFVLSVPAFAAIVCMTLSKLLEFKLAAVILVEMSAFELKAWLGITVFLSYITDLVGGTSKIGLSTPFQFGFIAVTAVGLFFIAKSGNEKINYKKIALPLCVYLLAKYGYGLTVNLTQNYISPTLSLFCALVILAVGLAPAVHPIRLFKEQPKGAAFVAITKIPNVIGLVTENIVAVQSMSNYAFIQPMILVALFFIGLIRREKATRLNIIGSIVCIIGIVGFQVLNSISQNI
jgi:hypothetical protein